MNSTISYSTGGYTFDEYDDFNDLHQVDDEYKRWRYWYTHPFVIRYSAFLLPGLCMGLPTLIWAVRSLHQQLQGGARVSTFIIFLLFSDILELILISFLGALFFVETFRDLIIQLHLEYAFISVRFCGFYFHQLVALEGLLALRNPLCSRRLSSPLLSIPLSITLWLCAFTADFPIIRTRLNSAICGLTCIVAVISCVLACKASCTSSHRDRKPALKMIAVALVTLIVLDGPYILGLCIDLSIMWDHLPWLISVFLMSLRLIADPLLCVLVCREISSRQPPDTNNIPI